MISSRMRWLASLGLVLASAGYAQAQDKPWWFTVYLQQSFPKQTNTNKQIQQINDTFGVHFEDWGDVANLNLGLQLFRQVSPYWKVGGQVDYSRGSISGKATIDTEAGPARLAFEQKYSVYADVYAVAHFLPCPDCERVIPFVYGGVGIAYEKDQTTLTLRNDYIDEGLKVDNDGTFPSYSVGIGADIPFGADRSWYAEVGGAYVWARLKHMVDAHGSLAPAPRVEADTDSTGPNYWIGIGRRF